MVAVIKVGKSIRRTFHYNENKVDSGVAELLMAANYPLEIEKMNAGQRLNMLLRTAESNPNIKSNSVHISLNFSVNDELNKDVLQKIAQEYMNAIGFGNQPYLVYKHNDAAHPHIHIATVKVDSEGNRIETQNIGKLLSEPARKAIEKKYGLVQAEQQVKNHFQLKPIDVQKVQYGKLPTKNAIANVLENVLTSYKYTSLAELNAILNRYNVMAERGQESSRTYKMRGLVYRITADDGTPIGVPIKASLFYNLPTLKYLEKRFIRNEVERQPHKEKIKSTIAFVLKSRKPKSLEKLNDLLKKEGLHMVLRTSKEGSVYGITYIDFKTKCIFNGSALGKNFSAKGVLDSINNHLQTTDSMRLNQINRPIESSQTNIQIASTKIGTEQENGTDKPQSNEGNDLIQQLLQPEHTAQYIPFDWKKKRKRKRRK